MTSHAPYSLLGAHAVVVLNHPMCDTRHHFTDFFECRSCALMHAACFCMKMAKSLVLCLDFHKSLYIPKVTSQDAYYKKRLITRLFGIYEAGKKRMHAFIYPSTVAGEGPDEVISLVDFLLNRLQSSSGCNRHLILWCDNCPGQFKECYLFFFCDYLIKTKRFLRVDLKFLLEGHTYSICDRRFGNIETASKRFEIIETPQDWVELLRTANIANMEIHEVTLDMIKSYKVFLRNAYVSRNKAEDGIMEFSVRNVAWLNFGVGELENDNGELTVTSIPEGHCLARYTIDPHVKPISVCFLKKKQRRELLFTDLKAKRNEFIPVFADVKKNCLDLANKYLSCTAIQYYESLPTVVDVDTESNASD